MTTPVLAARGIEKRFGSFRALLDVDFELQAGEVRALLGVNGAGKSTFVKILSGLYRKDAGTLLMAGQSIEIDSPAAALKAGIASVQQHPELVEDLPGYANIFLGNEGAGLLYGRAALRAHAAELAARHGLQVDVDKPVAQLSAIERELIAILRAISASDIRVLILDEPTSVLTQREKAILFALIDRLRQRGVGIIYITHRLDEVLEIADSYTVFRGGKVIGTQPVSAGADPAAIAEMMLGTTLGHVYPDKTPVNGSVVLDVRDLSLGHVFERVSFTARKGQIVGIFGLLGSGLDELSKALFGAAKPTAGAMSLHGKPVYFKTPRDALRAGMFLVPGDRRTEGLTLTRDVGFNTTLARLSKVSIGGLLRFAAARREASLTARRVDLQPLDIDQAAGSFSGGNQQKIVIAKGLFAEADVYLFVEPTVGVDIGARAKIYSLIRELSRNAAVVVMSSDADEVHGLADHLVGLFAGRVVVSSPSSVLSREALLVAGLSGLGPHAEAA